MLARRLALALATALTLTALPLAPTGAADPPDIVIGSVLPLTGASAQTEPHCAPPAVGAGLGQRPRELSAAHGWKSGLPHLGHARIKLVFADSQGKPDQARAAAEQLITQSTRSP